MARQTTFPLAPGGTIGILGGGQLGRMLAMAGARLGLRCHVYSDKDDAPAREVAAERSFAAFDDWHALDAFADGCDVVTFEFENVPAAALAHIGRVRPVFPPVAALEITQDRLSEKRLAERLGIATAPFAEVGSAGDLARALARIGRPALLKTRRFGYDGKGQVRIDPDTDVDEAFAATSGAPAIVEGLVAFEREISVVAARGQDGAMAFYDPSENTHANQILSEARVPARIAPAPAERARAITEAMATALDYVGVLCVELFVVPAAAGSELLVNEIAPRVHNSGHWTIEACLVSQFENHMRAVAGWPLGATERHSDAVMTNLIGADAHKWRELAAEPGLAVHLYGKGEARAGRKMGHCTRLLPRTEVSDPDRR